MARLRTPVAVRRRILAVNLARGLSPSGPAEQSRFARRLNEALADVLEYPVMPAQVTRDREGRLTATTGLTRWAESHLGAAVFAAWYCPQCDVAGVPVQVPFVADAEREYLANQQRVCSHEEVPF